MKKISAACVLTASIVLVGCEGMGPKQTAGTVIGGAGGALIGSTIGGGSGRVVATGVGAVLGALFGSYVGQQLDDRDRILAHDNAVVVLDRAPVAQSHTWRNSRTGRYGESTIISTNADGSCRTMRTITYNRRGVEIARETQTYCRNPAGTWVLG